MTREEEAQIVQQVLQGDVNAFEDLVTEYEKNVYSLTLRMTGNAEDAADMTQETFIKAYNSLSAFRGDSKFSVWLYRIATNVCLDFLRSRSRKPTVSLSMEDDDGEEVELDVADDSQSPERLLERGLTRDVPGAAAGAGTDEGRRTQRTQGPLSRVPADPAAAGDPGTELRGDRGRAQSRGRDREIPDFPGKKKIVRFFDRGREHSGFYAVREYERW